MTIETTTKYDDFRVFFSKKRQFLDVYLYEVHPNTFAKWDAGYWAYFIATWENPKQGKFGELHIVRSRIREDTVVHEIAHVVWEWMFANNIKFIRSNEEKFATKMDEIFRNFYRGYNKLKGR